MLSTFDRVNGAVLKLMVAVLVLAIAAVPALPHYVGQSWPWNKLPALPAIESLKMLQQNGLPLPDWETQDQQTIDLNGNQWSAQALHSGDRSAVLLLRPQVWERGQPQVEWTDIDGWQRWRVDSRSRLSFQTPSGSVNTRFFRGWSDRQTFAVLQWYAWSTGGDPSPARWFWVDQQQQWQTQNRMPWVAVCVLVPIPPLSDIEPVQAEAIELAQTIQTALVSGALRS